MHHHIYIWFVNKLNSLDLFVDSVLRGVPERFCSELFAGPQPRQDTSVPPKDTSCDFGVTSDDKWWQVAWTNSRNVLLTISLKCCWSTSSDLAPHVSDPATQKNGYPDPLDLNLSHISLAILHNLFCFLAKAARTATNLQSHMISNYFCRSSTNWNGSGSSTCLHHLSQMARLKTRK